MADVRRYEEGDLGALVRLMGLAFGASMEDARQYYTTNPRLDAGQVYVAGEGGEVRATATVLPLEAFVGGAARPVGAVAAVNTHPAHRRKGYAGELMRAVLEDMRACGVHLSMLWPFVHSFYRAFGYELAGESVSYQLNPQQLSTSYQQRRVREYTEDDLPSLELLHEERATEHALCLRRSGGHWGRVLDDSEAAVYEGEGLEGYVIYRMSGWREGEPRRWLTVREMVWRTPGALEGLLSFLAAQDPLVFRIKVSTPRGEPLHPYLRDSYVEAAVAPEFMLRLVDVEGALGFVEREISGRLVLEVSDDALPQNAGEYTVGGGGPQERVRLDVRRLTQLYAGYIPAARLHRRGLLQPSSPRALALLDELFPAADPWVFPPDHF